MSGRLQTLVTSVERLPMLRSALERRRRRVFESGKYPNTFWGVYDSFQRAQADAPVGQSVGYDGSGAAKASFYEWRMANIAACDYPALFWLSRLLSEAPRVLDYGGHVGILYYAFRRYLPPALLEKWQVYDVADVVAEGRAFAKGRDDAQGLSFIDTVRGAQADLLFCSGSLQYVDRPLSSIVAELAAPPRYVLVNMLPVHPDAEYVTLQNIGATSCPYMIRHRDRFVRDVEGAGYALKDAWQNADKACYIPMHPERSLDHYEGFLFERR